VAEFSFDEYRHLGRERDTAAYSAVGSAQAAIAFLKEATPDVEAALAALTRAVAKYDAADEALQEYFRTHKEVKRG
jgi:hypothetical protein